jgi:hypothetical protein
MIRRMLLPAALVSALLVHAGDSPRERATLKGSKGVSVIVDVLPEALTHEGVTEDGLRARLTQRLTEAGIPLDPDAKEFVGLSASVVRDSRGPYAVSFRLGFYQPATLARDPASRIAPETWEVDTILMAAPKMLQRAATDSVDDLAARFVAAWRSVNPQ